VSAVLDPGDAAPQVRSLAPYAARLLEAAARRALDLHADEVAPPHLLCALMEDEDCGAHQLVLHAFADPETVAVEALATAPGILVVGSARVLPFSVRGVVALRRARGAAEAAGTSADPEQVALGALAELEDALAAQLAAECGDAALADAPAREDDGSPLFAAFTDAGRRSLVRACRDAAGRSRAAISPVHLLQGALDEDPELARRLGLSAARVGALAGADDADPTPVPHRPLPAGEELRAFLAAVPPGADSTGLLETFLSAGADELQILLARSRVTPELLGRSRGAFEDPDPA
jgi:hypothetical protein